jgi:glyoxylase-like metal-dependent hydrolase (beta-lactamase superfamily II)
MSDPAAEPITTIAPDVYDLTLEIGEGRYRAFVFDGPTPTLVDCGLERTRETLIERLETLDIEPEILIITHVDHDHVGGFDVVVENYDPVTYVPLQSTLQNEEKVDHRYDHGDEVGPFEAVHVPGHSHDNYALVHMDRPIAVMGDAMLGADWRGLPAGYFVLVEGAYSNDLRAAERNLERLQEYEFDIGLVFHGSSVLENARDKLDLFVDFPYRQGNWYSEDELDSMRSELL